MARKVVIDDKYILTLHHKKFCHAGGGIGRDIAQPWRILIGGHHNNGIGQRSVLTQGVHHPRHSGAALANGAVDTDHLFVTLVDDGIDSHRGLARLAVANDQLALPAADGNQRINGLDTRLQRHTHRGTVDDGRRRLFNGTPRPDL